MDIFHIETASLSATRTNAIIDDSPDQIPQVSFDGGPEFNLNFFDSPDDSNTGYSDPGSVDSTAGGASSPPPPQQLANAIPSMPPTSFTTPANFPCIGSIGMFFVCLFVVVLLCVLNIKFIQISMYNNFKSILCIHMRTLKILRLFFEYFKTSDTQLMIERIQWMKEWMKSILLCLIVSISFDRYICMLKYSWAITANIYWDFSKTVKRSSHFSTIVSYTYFLFVFVFACFWNVIKSNQKTKEKRKIKTTEESEYAFGKEILLWTHIYIFFSAEIEQFSVLLMLMLRC